MNNNIISDKQGISIISMVLIGSSSIFIMGIGAKEDLWVAIILSILMAIPTALICARFYEIFPGKDLFDVIELCFNNFIGKILCGLYIFYFFFQVGDILRNASHFIVTTTLIKTPLLVIMIIFSAFSVMVVKKGFKVIVSCAQYFLIIYIILVIIETFFLMPNMDINNIKPILSVGMKPILKGAFLTFSFPFGEIIIFSMALPVIKGKKSSYKIYMQGLLLAGLILFIISINSILVLGVYIASRTNYPSYYTAQTISIGKYIQSIEPIVVIIFSLGIFIKISVYLFNSCKGISKIFKCSNYMFIVTPISILGIILSYTMYDNLMEFFEWDLNIWPYYAFPFQVIFPIIILLAAEIKNKKLI